MTAATRRDPDADAIEAVYDALDRGDPERALRRTEAALAADGEDDPVLHFLRGVARLELDRPAEAVESFARAVSLDPDDGEFRARLAEALFLAGRFAEGADEAERAVRVDDRSPLAHHAMGLFLERRARFEDADRAFARATELDPESFPRPVRLERPAFEDRVREAIDALPRPFRAALDEVAVSVEDLPGDELLRGEDPPLDPGLLGLFVGLPRGERGVLSPGGELPARIYLFQRNLERFAVDGEDLVEQIGITLRHELGHYLGLDEEEIDRAGHA